MASHPPSRQKHSSNSSQQTSQYKRVNKHEGLGRFLKEGSNGFCHQFLVEICSGIGELTFLYRLHEEWHQRQEEHVRMHNRLVDLKKEEAKKLQKQQRHNEEQERPVVPKGFGKESIQDEACDELIAGARLQKNRKRHEKEHLRKEKKVQLQQKEQSKKRKREDDDSQPSPEETPDAEAPPAKVQKTKEMEESEPTKSAPAKPSHPKPEHHQPEKPASSSKPAFTPRSDSKNGQYPTSTTKPEQKAEQHSTTTSQEPTEEVERLRRLNPKLAEARLRYEQREQERKERQEAYELRLENIEKRKVEKKKAGKRLAIRTPKGQPIMKNLLKHMMSKLEQK